MSAPAAEWNARLGKPQPVLLMVRGLFIGGCERDLTKIAIALDRSRFEPHVACFHSNGPRYPELQAAGVPVVELPVRSFASRSAIQGAREMATYIRLHGIQLIHAFDVPTSIFAAIASRFFPVPVVITTQLSYRNLYSQSIRSMLKLSDWCSDRIVVNSWAVGKSLQVEEGLAAERISLIYNGVDPSVFNPRERRRPEWLANASLVVGTVCVVRPEKRIDLLMRAFAEVKPLRPGMKLVIMGGGNVGGGDMMPELDALRLHLGLEQDCHVIPQETDVGSWMRAMDVYVLSSESESFPNALLEAMACGCCVIGSRVGGIPELIYDGKNGLLFESGNAADLARVLTKAVHDDGLRERLGQQASVTALDNFSIEIAARRTEALYESLLDGDCVASVRQSTLK
jgi:glycosyltransferase involved in cell wall biosynthesis